MEEQKALIDETVWSEDDENEEQIDTSNATNDAEPQVQEKRKPLKQYKSTFKTTMDEEPCPYKKCGRKFASMVELKKHVDRRHQAPQANE